MPARLLPCPHRCCSPCELIPKTLCFCLISAIAHVKITAMRWLLLIVVLLVAASGATYANYGGLSPCRWLAVDTAEHTGLPENIAAARARADMALHGDLDPDAVDCLRGWWRVRYAKAHSADI